MRIRSGLSALLCRGAALATAVVAVGCRDAVQPEPDKSPLPAYDQLPPATGNATGNVVVQASTVGADLDPDGYTVTLDSVDTRPVATNGSVTFTEVWPGRHTVTLRGVAANCAASGANPRTVMVPARGTDSTTFSVSCTATTGTLEVITATTGSDLDPDGYTVIVGDNDFTSPIGTNDTIRFTGVAAANQTVALSGVAANCAVSDTNPRTVTVPPGGTGSTTFSVSCGTTTTLGDLTITAATTGQDLDPDGYRAAVTGATHQTVALVPTNGSVTLTGIPAGDYQVKLSSGVQWNCTWSGANPQMVTVPAGGTASTTFSLSCSPATSATASLEVSTATTGSDLDPDGYTVVLDDGAATSPIGVNAIIRFTGLTPGEHKVELTGVASNCTVSPPHPRTANLLGGFLTSTNFDVSCTAISTSATGPP